MTSDRGARVSKRGRLARQRGQSTVEFALVLPFIFVLLLGLLQAGLLLRDQLVVAGAAREGAREAAVSPEIQKIEAAVRRAAPDIDLSIKVDRGPRRGDVVRVSVIARPTALPLVGGMVSGRKLSSSAVMRVEQAG